MNQAAKILMVLTLSVYLCACQSHKIKCNNLTDIDMIYKNKAEYCDKISFNSSGCDYYTKATAEIQASCPNINHKKIESDNLEAIKIKKENAELAQKKFRAEEELRRQLAEEQSKKARLMIEACDKVKTSLDLRPSFVNSAGFSTYVNHDNLISFGIDYDKDSCTETANPKFFIRPLMKTSSSKYNYSVSFNGNKYSNGDSGIPDKMYFNHQNAKGIVNPVVTLDSINVSNVLPLYQNGDRVIQVLFKDDVMSIANKSKQFVKITSVWMYYKDKIFKSIYNDLELPPESSKNNVYLTLDKEEIRNLSSFEYVTKSKAKNIIFNYGFAINYTIGNKNFENTLYSTKNQVLSDML